MIEELDETAKTLLWCLGHLKELQAHGLVEGPDPLTNIGISQFDQLVASGWKPNEDEMRDCLRHLQTKGIEPA